jgi:hypothetical protein
VAGGIKTNKAIPLILALAVAATLYLLFVLLSSARPQLALDDLLVSSPSFPTRWDSGELPVRVTNWQQTDKSNDGTLVSVASSMSHRAWASYGMPTIYQTVLLFNNPVEAYWNFWLRRPENARFDDWPNFTYGCDRCYPRHWDDKSTHADQQHIVCGMGVEGDCQVFYYWARYGQYIVQVELFAPNQGADNDTFTSIVNEIDQWIWRKLKP